MSWPASAASPPASPEHERRVISPPLLALWLHVLGVVVWVGGVAYQAHVLGPAARRGAAALFA